MQMSSKDHAWYNKGQNILENELDRMGILRTYADCLIVLVMDLVYTAIKVGLMEYVMS